ncbi:MAG: hypothetical protein ACLSA6_17470 [Holdemania massiliensis]
MAGGTAQLALDRVEAGENLEITKTRKTLPEGITRGMLMKDVLRIAGPSFVELTLTADLHGRFDGRTAGGLGDYVRRINNAAEVFNDDDVYGDECRGYRSCGSL